MRTVLCLLLLIVAAPAAAETKSDALADAKAANKRLSLRIQKLEREVRELTDQLQTAYRKLAAANGEAATLKLRREPSAPNGKVSGGKFTYGNLFAQSDDDHLKLVGEIENVSGKSWEATIFEVAVYNELDRPLGVEMVVINHFEPKALRTFEILSRSIPFAHGYRYKFAFSGGVETTE